jgi:hypothetical protein
MEVNTNERMQQLASYAIKVAKEKFSQTLDYSAQSLQPLDDLLKQTFERFNYLAIEGKLSETTIKRAAEIWGSYLGEVIRQNLSGEWIMVDESPILRIGEHDFFPIKETQEQLTSPKRNIIDYFKQVKKTVDEKTITVSKPAPIKENASSPSVPKTDEKMPSKRKWGGVLFALIGAILILIIIVALMLPRGLGISQEFASDLESFLVEAEKLNVMTEQGVNYPEFRNQLAQVKATYAQIDNWPSIMQLEKENFDAAIDGWDITLRVWRIGLDASWGMDLAVLPDDSGELKDAATYMNVDLGDAQYVSIKRWIENLMTTSSTRFELGKQGVRSIIK